MATFCLSVSHQRVRWTGNRRLEELAKWSRLLEKAALQVLVSHTWRGWRDTFNSLSRLHVLLVFCC